MKATIRKYDGTKYTADVKFEKTTTEYDEFYTVTVDGFNVGRVAKSEERSPVYASGRRYAVGHNVTKGWKARNVRYATIKRSRLGAVADLLDGVSTVERAS